MKQVIDTEGRAIRGLFREQNGGLVVDDQLRYKKALAEKERIEKVEKDINTVMSKVDKLEDLIKTLISSITK